MSKPCTDKLQERVLSTLLWAPDDIIEEYKLQFLKMPVEVSRLDFFHPSNREEWVNINRYCNFICHKLFWSGDHFVSGQSTNRFWLGYHGQQNEKQHYPTWRGGILVDSPASQPLKEITTTSGVTDDCSQSSKEREIIVISSDEDEDSLEEIFRRLRRQRKAKEVIVISSDDDEPFVESLVSRKRKARSVAGGSEQGVAKRRTHIRVFEPEVITAVDSDSEAMTVVG